MLLNVEVDSHILAFIPPGELWMVSRVCKTWYQICKPRFNEKTQLSHLAYYGYIKSGILPKDKIAVQIRINHEVACTVGSPSDIKPTVAPTQSGVQPTVAPTQSGVQPTVAPTQSRVQPTVAPTQSGVQLDRLNIYMIELKCMFYPDSPFQPLMKYHKELCNRNIGAYIKTIAVANWLDRVRREGIVEYDATVGDDSVGATAGAGTNYGWLDPMIPALVKASSLFCNDIEIQVYACFATRVSQRSPSSAGAAAY